MTRARHSARCNISDIQFFKSVVNYDFISMNFVYISDGNSDVLHKYEELLRGPKGNFPLPLTSALSYCLARAELLSGSSAINVLGPFLLAILEMSDCTDIIPG
jgi:hypothetical protein